MIIDPNHENPTPSLAAVLADLRARMDARLDEHGAELASARFAVVDRLRKLQESVDALSGAGASDAEPDPNDLYTTQMADIMSQRTGRSVDDDMEALRRNFARLQAAVLHEPGMRAQLPQPRSGFRRCGRRSGVPAQACG